MNKILLSLLLSVFITSAYADGREYRGDIGGRHERFYRHGNEAGWIVPFLVGGALTYIVTEGRRDTPPRDAVEPPRDQPIYKYDWIYFDECDCKKRTLVRVN